MAGRWAATRWGWLVALGVVSGVVAFSAGLTVNGSTLGGGSATTTCDSDGVTVLEGLSGTNIASVTVSGIDAACQGTGSILSLRVRNDSVEGKGTLNNIPASGSGTVTLDVAVPLTEVTSVFVLLQGP